MSSKKDSGAQGSKSTVKKGAVIHRNRNRTVDQSRAHSNPKWKDVGGGVLVQVNGLPNPIHRSKDTNKWESLPLSESRQPQAPTAEQMVPGLPTMGEQAETEALTRLL